MTGLTKISAEVEHVSPAIMVGLKGTRVTTTRSNLGPILADSRGETLYLFERDMHAISACTGTCASYWTPLLTTGAPVATAGVKTALLGTARRTDGILQVTPNTGGGGYGC